MFTYRRLAMDRSSSRTRTCTPFFNGATDSNQTLGIKNTTFGGDPQIGVVKQADNVVTFVTDDGHWSDTRWWMQENDVYGAENPATYHA